MPFKLLHKYIRNRHKCFCGASSETALICGIVLMENCFSCFVYLPKCAFWFHSGVLMMRCLISKTCT